MPSDISNYLNQIRTAVYGREVREAIADGIEQCYNDTSNGVTLAETKLSELNGAVERLNSAVDNAEANMNEAVSDALESLDDAVESANGAVTTANAAATRAQELNTALGDNANDLVLVQNEQPNKEFNKIWVDPDVEEHEVPTYQEFSDLKSAVDEIRDTTSPEIINTINASINGSTGKITSNSNSRTAYADIAGAKRVTVQKNAGATFGIGFAQVTPANKVTVDGVIYNSTGTTISSIVPSGAKYLCIYYWNSSPSRDGETGESDMLASIVINAIMHNAKIRYITPEMFGAVGNGTTDDSAALQSACDYAASIGVPMMLTQTYAITETINVSGRITGHGTVKLLDQTDRLSGCLFQSSSDTYIDGITFDCRSTEPMTIDDKFTPYNVGLKHTSGGLTVKNCVFRNLYRTFITLSGNAITNVHISGNLFDASNKSNRYFAACINVGNAINETTISIIIANNEFRGYVGTDDTLDNACAITVSNTIPRLFVIDGNVMRNLGRLATNDVDGVTQYGNSRLCAIDVYFNAKNVIISNNKLLKCNWTPIRIHGAKNVQIVNNEISIRNYIQEPMIWISDSPSSDGQNPIGTEYVSICGNMIVGRNDHVSSVFQINSVPRHETEASELSNLIIKDNTVKNIRAEYVFKVDDSLKSCMVEGNNIVMSTPSSGMSTTGIAFVTPEGNNDDYEGMALVVRGNHIKTYNNVFDMSGCADPLNVKIIGNMFESETGICIKGIDNTDNVIAISNVLYGNSGIERVAKSINNVSFCTTNYTNNAETFGNYPAN